MTRIMTVALLALALGAATAVAQEPERRAVAKTVASTPGAVNLNTATLAQLESLPGIGTKTAERIVEYRQKNGGFKKIEELMNVRGVGEKSFLKLKPLVSVAAPKTDRATAQD